MDFTIDKTTQEKLEKAREWGRAEMRPAGIEADQLSRPIPVDHDYFKKFIAKGEGRTRWPGPKGRERPSSGPRPSVVSSLLMSEELAYWDRGVTVANPGPGYPSRT